MGKIQLGFDYISRKHEGSFNNQLAVHRGFYGFARFSDDSSAYKALLRVANRKSSLSFHGGVEDINDYQSANFTTAFLPTQLLDASMNNNTKEINFEQSWRLSNVQLFTKSTHTFTETNYYDNIQTSTNYYIPSWEGTNTEFWFKSIWSDWQNEMGIQIGNNAFINRSSIKLSNSNLTYYNGVNSLNTIWINNATSVIRDKLTFTNELELGLAGYQGGNYREEFTVLSKNAKKSAIGLSLKSASLKPDLVFSNYFSTHQAWNNSLNSIGWHEGTIHFSLREKLTLSATQKLITNYTYFDELRTPSQLNAVTTGTDISLSALIELKSIYWKPRIQLQNYTSSVIQVPNYTLFSNFYFKDNWFSNNMLVNIGFDIFYTANYTLPGFFLPMNQYYFDQSQTGGNYPFIDVYFSGKVKSVRFFVKGINAFQLYNQTSGLIVKDVPYQDFSFMFGFNWIFLN